MADTPAVSELIQRMTAHTACIADLEADLASEEERQEHAMYMIQQRNPERASSWLSHATNPVWHLLGLFQRRPRRELTPVQAQQDRLARVAASTMLPPLDARAALPHGILAVVVGNGRLGCRVAGELLRRGCSVRLVDPSSASDSGDGLGKLVDDIRENIRQGTLMPSDLHGFMARCSLVPSLFEAIEDFGCMAWVVEAIPEDVTLKRGVFQEAANVCAAKHIPPHRVLFSSNTVSCRVADITLGMYNIYAVRVLGVRFLNPVWFVDAIALTRNGAVADECERDTLGAALQLLIHLGFNPFFELLPNPPSKLPSRRKLTYEEALIYASRQQMCCELASPLAPGGFDPQFHPTSALPPPEGHQSLQFTAAGSEGGTGGGLSVEGGSCGRAGGAAGGECTDMAGSEAT